MITFAHPNYLWLLLVLVPLAVWYVLRRRQSHATMLVTSLSPFAKLGTSWKVWWMHLMFVCRLMAVACLIVILARPQTHDSWSTSETEGTDIVVALDISTSMLAQDFRPNRFEAAKDVACQFVSGRETDNIGFVIFAAESFTQVPMTTDKAALINAIQNIEMGALEDGTAIGDGIATSINRIKEGKAKSKSIILLTDGSNNRGDIDPLTAAEIAKTFGIRVYAIGVGSHGQARVPVQTPMGVQYMTMDSEFDETTLQNIASTTGGQYFRATDNNSLKQIYEQIDQLEKTKLRVREYAKHTATFAPFLMAALLCLLAEILLRYFVLRTISN